MTKISGMVQLAEQKIEVPQYSDPKRLWAFYYPWYWDNGSKWAGITHITDRPMLGEYKSSSPQVMERHIRMAQHAGIDAFVCSWWGDGGSEDQRFEEMLPIAERVGFQLSIYLEILTLGSAQPDNVIRGWLEYILKKYGDHPAFAKLDGKPVIWIWAGGAVPLQSWKEILNGLDAKFIGFGSDINDLSVFAGLHEYNTMDVENLPRHYGLIKKSTDFYAHQQGVPKFYAPTVLPGFYKKNFHFKLEREGGDTYERFWQAAVGCDPHDIVITSWNEWPEATYIEPSREYGTKYLRITKEFAEPWKKK